MGPGAIANLETLGYVDLARSDYFRRGTHMHVSHIVEDVEAWYLNFDFRERVDTAFRPNLRVRDGAQTVRQGPDDVSDTPRVRRDFHASGRIGHSASIQTTSRLAPTTSSAGRDASTRRGRRSRSAPTSTRSTIPFAWSTAEGEVRRGAGRRRPLRRLQPVERRLPPQPPRDGRRPSGRQDPVPASRPRPGVQRRALDDAPPELPRPAAPRTARSRSRRCDARRL